MLLPSCGQDFSYPLSLTLFSSDLMITYFSYKIIIKSGCVLVSIYQTNLRNKSFFKKVTSLHILHWKVDNSLLKKPTPHGKILPKNMYSV